MDRPVPQHNIREQRERTVAALCEQFAADNLALTELERRLDTAHRAHTADELAALLQDLPALRPSAEAARPAPPAGVPTGPSAGKGTRDTRTMVAFMGGVERKGHWAPGRRNLVVAFMGGASLDFRDLKLPPGETEVVLFCFMGGAEIIVPPGLVVDASGIAIMGGFEHASPGPGGAADGAVLKVTGVAIMGGVEITEREPGESAKDARRREKERSRALREERSVRRQRGREDG